MTTSGFINVVITNSNFNYSERLYVRHLHLKSPPRVFFFKSVCVGGGGGGEGEVSNLVEKEALLRQKVT